jgi:hypothetical protein
MLEPITLTAKTVIAIYASGFLVNLSQGVCTFLVLFLLGKPMLEKIDRIKVKYGMMEEENML